MWGKRGDNLRIPSKVRTKKVEAMKIIRHIYKKAIGFIKAITCKHEQTRESSCPFTGITYTICKDCTKIVSGKVTEYGS